MKRSVTLLAPAAVALLLSACATDASTANATAPGSTSGTPGGGSTSTAPTETAATPSQPGGTGSATPDAEGSGSPAAGMVSCAYEPAGEPAKPVDPPPAQAPATGTVTLTLATNEGDVTITMDRAKAPCTVSSIESLAKQQYFDQTSCHRLTDQGIFVLQCGDPTGTGTGGPGYQFADELSGKESYTAGSVAMANTGQPGTNGSQFFIVYQDSTSLPPSYTLFGRTDAKGLQAVNAIADGGHDGSSGAAGGGKPNNEATITQATLG